MGTNIGPDSDIFNKEFAEKLADRLQNPRQEQEVIKGLLDLLEEYQGLIDHLLDSDPIAGHELETDIREAQRRNRLKTENLKRNFQLNGWIDIE